MAVGIMIAGFLAAVFGTALALAIGLDVASALFVYGAFGAAGGVLASLGILPLLRNLARLSGGNNRTAG